MEVVIRRRLSRRRVGLVGLASRVADRQRISRCSHRQHRRPQTTWCNAAGSAPSKTTTGRRRAVPCEKQRTVPRWCPCAWRAGRPPYIVPGAAASKCRSASARRSSRSMRVSRADASRPHRTRRSSSPFAFDRDAPDPSGSSAARKRNRASRLAPSQPWHRVRAPYACGFLRGACLATGHSTGAEPSRGCTTKIIKQTQNGSKAAWFLRLTAVRCGARDDAQTSRFSPYFFARPAAALLASR